MSDTIEKDEISLTGAPGCPGIAIGKTSLYQRSRPSVSKRKIDDGSVSKQVDYFRKALEIAETELNGLLRASNDNSANELIEAQIAMLKDPDLCDQVEDEIKDNKPADLAVQSTFESYLELIRQNHGEAFLERSVDITDVRDRLIQILHNKKDDIEEGIIIVARELSPREVISFSNKNIKGIITDHGGTTSHAAIIARSMNIPTVVGAKNATEVICSDDQVVVDGRNGEVTVHPLKETRHKYQELIDQQVQAETDFEKICEEPNKTKDGVSFSLQANVEFAEELSTAQKFRAEGVGLLRTESIYLSHENFSDQEQQESFYKSILQTTRPHPVTIRLFDAGGDKFFEESEPEQNPFLGWRGIRMLLDEKKMLKSQLKAILSTAAKFQGRIRILVPMVSTLDELQKVKELMEEVQQELVNDGVSIDEDVPLGIMVEVPSVALKADLFAQHADFLSIGTNDLTQYVLAVDRGNEQISNLYDQRHPAIWELIKKVAAAAEKEEVPLSLCGELASDPIAACCLMGFGISELSMNSVMIPVVKQELRDHSLKEMQRLSEGVLASDTLDDINQIFSNWKTKSIS